MRLLRTGVLAVGSIIGIAGACSPPPPPPDPDIRFIDETNQNITFGHTILSTETDVLFETELGVTPFIALAPQFFLNPVGVGAHFRSPFANTMVVPLDANQCPTTPTNGNCEFTADAELEMFTRSPAELYRTLTTADPGDGTSFLQDLSTPRVFPTGEATTTLNPTPFSLPDVVVANVTNPPRTQIVCTQKFGCRTVALNQPAIDPINSTWFWFDNQDSQGPAVSSILWGPPGNTPLGLGSIKAARLVQHGPVEIEVGLQGPLNDVKEELVSQGLDLCQTTHGGFPAEGKITDVQINTFDAVPFITRDPSPGGFNTFQTGFGLLVHGDLLLSATGSLFGVPIATAPCGVTFLYEYRASVVDGHIKVTPKQWYFDRFGGGQGDVDALTNVCHWATAALIGDSSGNGLDGNPPILTGGVVSKMEAQLNKKGSLDTATISFGLGLTGSQVKCHSSVGTAPSCASVASKLIPLATKGATTVLGTLSATDIQAITDTINFGATSPGSGGNWSCDGNNDDCTLNLPVQGIIGQPDVVDVIPFASLRDFGSPMLMLFYFLVNFDSSTFPVSNIFNRAPRVPGSHLPIYNRLYASVNVHNLSCANHDPSEYPTLSCATNGDCNNPLIIQNARTGFCDTVAKRCDRPASFTCQNSGDCMPWEECTGNGKKCSSCFSACVPIGGCDDSDPFAKGVCPVVHDGSIKVATFCNAGECWRQ